MSFSTSPFSSIAFSDSGDSSVNVTVNVSGVAATGQVDSVTASIPVTVLLSGWGFGAWNQNSWGINGTVPIATGAVGTVSLELDTTVDVTGVEARGAFGIGWGGGAWNTNAWSSQPVTVETGTGVSINVTGITSTGQVDNGTTVIEGQAGEINVSGIGATGGVGNVTLSLGTSTTVNGVQSTGQIASVTVIGRANVYLDGVQGTGALSSVSIEIDKTVNVTGVSASGFAGNVLVWGNIIPNPGTVWANIGPSQGAGYNPVTTNQTPNWNPINTSQTPNYSVVSTNQTPNWKDIAA
jgi:hypothetical protein